jgi:hypothetical protein
MNDGWVSRMGLATLIQGARSSIVAIIDRLTMGVAPAQPVELSNVGSHRLLGP